MKANSLCMTWVLCYFLDLTFFSGYNTLSSFPHYALLKFCILVDLFIYLFFSCDIFTTDVSICNHIWNLESLTVPYDSHWDCTLIYLQNSDARTCCLPPVLYWCWETQSIYPSDFPLKLLKFHLLSLQKFWSPILCPWCANI